jgi:TnpA family transposase
MTAASKNQRYRASDLTLVMAAIILWNTAYLSRAIQRLKAHSVSVDGG